MVLDDGTFSGAKQTRAKELEEILVRYGYVTDGYKKVVEALLHSEKEMLEGLKYKGWKNDTNEWGERMKITATYGDCKQTSEDSWDSITQVVHLEKEWTLLEAYEVIAQRISKNAKKDFEIHVKLNFQPK